MFTFEDLIFRSISMWSVRLMLISIGQGNPVLLVLLDLSAAFDIVDYNEPFF